MCVRSDGRESSPSSTLGPSEQPGPAGTGTSWVLRSLPTPTTVTVIQWFQCPKRLLCFFVLPKLGLLLLHQTSGGTSNWSDLLSVQKLTVTPGQSSPPQPTSVFAILQEVQLGGRFFYGFEYLPLKNRTYVVAKPRAEHDWYFLLLAPPFSSAADTDSCSFLPQPIISFMAVSSTLGCVRIPWASASSGLIHVKLLAWEKLLLEKKNKNQ